MIHNYLVMPNLGEDKRNVKEASELKVSIIIICHKAKQLLQKVERVMHNFEAYELPNNVNPLLNINEED
jgi:hypothetical protein